MKTQAEAIASIQESIEWMREDIAKNELQIDLTRNSVRGHNRVICSEHGGFLQIVDRKTNAYNFGARAHNAPRYTPEDAAEIAAELTESRGFKVFAMFDVNAMKAEIESLQSSIEWSEDLINSAA